MLRQHSVKLLRRRNTCGGAHKLLRIQKCIHTYNRHTINLYRNLSVHACSAPHAYRTVSPHTEMPVPAQEFGLRQILSHKFCGGANQQRGGNCYGGATHAAATINSGHCTRQTLAPTHVFVFMSSTSHAWLTFVFVSSTSHVFLFLCRRLRMRGRMLLVACADVAVPLEMQLCGFRKRARMLLSRFETPELGCGAKKLLPLRATPTPSSLPPHLAASQFLARLVKVKNVDVAAALCVEINVAPVDARDRSSFKRAARPAERELLLGPP